MMGGAAVVPKKVVCRNRVSTTSGQLQWWKACSARAAVAAMKPS